jgi:hypothetical protein
MLGMRVGIHEEGSLRQMRFLPLPPLRGMRLPSNPKGVKSRKGMRGSLLRVQLMEILRVELPLNGMQVCRILNGGKSRYDIKFCRPFAWKYMDSKSWSAHGNHPYDNCVYCSVKAYRVAHTLEQLEREGKVESKKGWRRDPIKPQRKDKMKTWALRGRLPKMDKWLK